ncbi:hypothetical protein ACP70R_030056 [Stipagrostis hirtigluma subsp. patula]
MGFAVQRTSRSFVPPSAPTPSGSLELSSIDRVVGLRHQVRSLHVFAPRREELPGGGEHPPPRVVIREALGKVLVDYYPMAGRLVDGHEGPSSARVECTGEGAWFVEATAECSLEDAGRLEHYPFVIPEDDLLPDAAPGVEPLDLPLMVQVTEFTCGGFVVGLMSSHTMTDGLGAGQFLNAVGDYARGLPKPRVTPIWARVLIPNPPKPLSRRPPNPPTTYQFQHLAVDLSDGSVNESKARFLQSKGQRCSTFEVAVARTWQARTRSLRLADPSARVTLCFPASARHLLRGDAWEAKGGGGAAGFYGNCLHTVAVEAESSAVEGADVVDLVAMVREAKARLPAEFARWAAGELVDEDPYELRFMYETLFVSDWRRMGFQEVDFGWGAPSQVIPLAYHPFMPIALIGAPPAPRTGVRIMTRCVEEEHMPAFREEIKAFEM